MNPTSGSELMEAFRRLETVLRGQHSEPVQGVVGPDVDLGTETTTVIVDGEEILSDVRWITPQTPAPGSRCLVVFRDGEGGRGTIVSCEASLQYSMVIGEKFEVMADATRIGLYDSTTEELIFGALASGQIQLGKAPTTLLRFLSDLCDVFLSGPIVENPETSTGLPLAPSTLASLTALKATLTDIFNV